MFGPKFIKNNSNWAQETMKTFFQKGSFDDLNDAFGEIYVLGFPIVQQFLLSNLLLNNYGRAVQQVNFIKSKSFLFRPVD